MDDTTAVARSTAQAPPWDRQSCLNKATLESVFELNEQVLALLRAQCLADAARPPLISEVGTLLSGLDARSVRRAAASAVLLVDAGLADAGLWSAAIVGAINDRPPAFATPFFTVNGAADVMRLVMTQAWHLARSEPAAARLLLGLSVGNLTVIGSCPLSLLTRLAETRVQWLRPRWEHRPRVWRDLLRMAGETDGSAAERMRARGLQLLAAEARQG